MIRRVALALILLAAPCGARFNHAWADDTLTLYFHERAPYSVRQADGSVHGITADLAARALEAAGIPYRWEDLPSARQMEVIKRSEAPACGLGWFKRPDREAFAKFTTPIYRDLPTIVMARGDDKRFDGAPSLDALFADKSLTLLIKTGYSYGAEIDAKIKELAPTLVSDASDNRTMLGMVQRGRADYMLMAMEEASDLLKQPEIAAEDLVVRRLQDPPPGEYRYLMCSKAVPDALLARINQAIPDLP